MSYAIASMLQTLLRINSNSFDENKPEEEGLPKKRKSRKLVYWTDKEKEDIYTELAKSVVASNDREALLKNSKIFSKAIFADTLADMVAKGKLGPDRVKTYDALSSSNALAATRQVVKEKINKYLSWDKRLQQ